MTTNHNPETVIYCEEVPDPSVGLSEYEPAETSTSRPCREEVAALWALEKKLGQHRSNWWKLNALHFMLRMDKMLSLVSKEDQNWKARGYESEAEAVNAYLLSGELDVAEGLTDWATGVFKPRS